MLPLRRLIEHAEATHILREYLAHVVAPYSEGIFRASIRYINEHFDEPVHIEDLAAQEGVTPNYYSSRFKRYYHISPVDYVHLKRIERAKVLMRDDAIPLKEIAYRVGYEYPHHFTTVFKKHEGISPSRYRALTYHLRTEGGMR